MGIGRKRLERSEAQHLISSHKTTELTPQEGPRVAHSFKEPVARVWAVGFEDTPGDVNADGTTVHGVIGSFDLERRPRGSRPFKYDRFLVVEDEAGAYWQIGPLKNLDYGHHREDPPEWTY